MKHGAHPWKRTPGAQLTQRNCARVKCGKAFTSVSVHALFCSTACRKAHDREKRN